MHLKSSTWMNLIVCDCLKSYECAFLNLFRAISFFYKITIRIGCYFSTINMNFQLASMACINERPFDDETNLWNWQNYQDFKWVLNSTIWYTFGWRTCAGFYHQMPVGDGAWSTLEGSCFVLLATVSDVSTLFSFYSGSSTINRAILTVTRSCSAWNRHILIQWIHNTITPISPGCALCNH